MNPVKGRTFRDRMTRREILAVEAVTDFIIGGGGALVTAMIATGETRWPSAAAILFAIVTGLISAANQVRGRIKDLPA